MADIVVVDRLDDRIRICVPSRCSHYHYSDFFNERNPFLGVERSFAQSVECVLNLR